MNAAPSSTTTVRPRGWSSPTARALIIGADAAVLVLLAPLAARLISPDTLGFVAGLVFGGGLVALIFAAVVRSSRRLAPGAALAWIGVLLVLTGAIGLVVESAPLAAWQLVLVALAAGGLAAGLAALALRAQAARAAERAAAHEWSAEPDTAEPDTAGVAGARVSSDDEVGGAYSAMDALADVENGRSGVADRALGPWWYYPVVGLALAAICLVVGLDGGVAATIIVALVAAVVMAGAVGFYQRSSGLRFTRVVGGRARPWFVAYVVAIVVGMGMAYAAQPASSWPLAVAGALVALVGVIVFGRMYDRRSRDELRAGQNAGAKR